LRRSARIQAESPVKLGKIAHPVSGIPPAGSNQEKIMKPNLFTPLLAPLFAPLLGLLSLCIMPEAGAADNGLVSKPSKYSVADTINRVETVVKAKGMTVFARIDHAAEAEKAGLKMHPTQLLIFGNPKGGTPLMQANPTIAIDLPMKALAWEDDNGKVWLSYNAPAFLKNRHDVKDELAKSLSGIVGLMDAALE
jgi:uncharacterized protein (DUF302 family)